MRRALALALVVALPGTAAASVTSLTPANFKSEALDSGKNAFVKFFAPWCGHCKAMAPAWEKLAEAYEGTSALIAEVDCTADGSDLCEKYGVRGYPTLKYFTQEKVGEAQDYEGGRSFDDFKEHVENHLIIKCTLEDQEGCSDREKEFIAKARKMDAGEVAKQVSRLTDLSSGSMKPALKAWVHQRLRILKQVA